MARHGTDAATAFEMLRERSQEGGHKVADVAAAVVESHALLIPHGAASPAAPEEEPAAAE